MDITREKQLLEATKSRVEQFREISNTVPAIIWISDRNKNTTFLNDNWYEYTGGTPETDLEKGWLHRVHPEDRAKTLNILDTSFDKRSKFKLEFRLKNRVGSYCWFINQGRPLIDDSGVFKGFIGSCVDINDRKEFTDKLEDMVQKRTQELNEANEELVKVNMNLEEYAYVTSHDLQEPIRKIRTFNSILQDNIQNGEALEYSKKIEKSAERMTALVNNVLDYSKLSNLTALKEKVDLNYIIDNIIDDLELLIDDTEASIEYKNLGEVQGMELQLQQLFSNIIKNAIKFNEQTPKVKITSKKVNGEKLRTYFKSNLDQDYLEVKITDNGIGIDEEFQDQVFKPFRRLNSKTKYGGTGIGLAICRRIAEFHNGHITIDKSNDRGTTFLVFLPVSEVN